MILNIYNKLYMYSLYYISFWVHFYKNIQCILCMVCVRVTSWFPIVNQLFEFVEMFRIKLQGVADNDDTAGNEQKLQVFNVCIY